MVADRQTKEPAVSESMQLMEETKKRGLLIGRGGLYGNGARVAPCLNIGPDGVDAFLAIFDESLAATAA